MQELAANKLHRALHAWMRVAAGPKLAATCLTQFYGTDEKPITTALTLGNQAPSKVLEIQTAQYAALTMRAGSAVIELWGRSRLPREAAAEISRPSSRSRDGRSCRQSTKYPYNSSPVSSVSPMRHTS